VLACAEGARETRRFASSSPSANEGEELMRLRLISCAFGTREEKRREEKRREEKRSASLASPNLSRTKVHRRVSLRLCSPSFAGGEEEEEIRRK